MKHHEVIVVGAGMSGICVAIDLAKAGIEDFCVFEKADDVGGTWRDNRYPGVACDVPSHLYSYSFAPNPNWSKWYGTGQEIWDYIRDCAKQFDVFDRIEFQNSITTAAWQDTHWLITDKHGQQFTAQYLIAAMGGLHTPNIPQLPGMDAYKGTLFHTTRWRHDIDLSGLRVGVVGTGATAVQFIPEIADQVAELVVFQRSPVWVGPKRDPVYSEEEKQIFASDPAIMKKHRWDLWQTWESTGIDMATAGTYANVTAESRAREMIEQSVHDPDLRASLTPDYNFTCKRPTLSNVFYATFEKENVHLVTAPVEAMTETGLVAADQNYDVDVVILATGFKPLNITHEIDLYGIDGLSLTELWKERVTSYKSIMVNEFPNLFLMMGPNSAGLTSALQMIEQQSRFAVGTIKRMKNEGISSINPKAEEMDKFTERLKKAFKYTTHNKGCTSWWSDGSGHNHSIWPESSVTYRMMLMEADFGEFDIISVASTAAQE